MGCRAEPGQGGARATSIPRPVPGRQADDIKSIKREDWDVIEYLKAQEPELYKSLKKSARSKGKKAA